MKIPMSGSIMMEAVLHISDMSSDSLVQSLWIHKKKVSPAVNMSTLQLLLARDILIASDHFQSFFPVDLAPTWSLVCHRLHPRQQAEDFISHCEMRHSSSGGVCPPVCQSDRRRFIKGSTPKSEQAPSSEKFRRRRDQIKFL